jgi:hypothetical protein
MQILQDKEPNYRVFNTTVSPFNDASTSYYHKSIGGYHGAKLRRYQDLIEHHLSVGNMEVLNMLNTKYFIVGNRGEAPQAQANPGRLGNAWFVKNVQWVNNADQEIIHLGRVIELKALGNIDAVQVYGRALNTVDTLLFTSPLEISFGPEDKKSLNLSRLPLEPGMTYILGNDPTNMDSNFIDISSLDGGKLLAAKQFEAKVIFDFNPRNTAVIDKRYKTYMEANTFNYLPSSSIQLTEYKPNNIKYTTKAESNQLAVFSEIHYEKGWNAYVDGQLVDYIRADYVLRSMVVPAGSHTVEFKFEPNSYRYGRLITMFSSITLMLLVISAIVWQFRKSKVEEA